MTRETIKEYILQIKSQDGTEALYNRWEPDILVEVINEIFNDHEAQLKAKDEEIKELECRTYHAEGCISDLHNSPKVKKFYDKKARSIVAMLFWEWKKSIRESGDNTFYNDEFDDGNYWFVNAKEQSFKQAYKILKDNQ